MIKTETITINGTEFTRTYSDTNMMIERDGETYSEAVDPVGSGREYVETDTKNEEELTPMTADEYLAAREELIALEAAEQAALAEEE